MKAYLMHIEQLAAQLQTDIVRGLSQQAVGKRLREYGLNTLPEKKPTSAFTVLIRQFLSPLMFVLLIAAAASVVIAEYSDAIIIAFAAFINVIVGFIQEYKAERAAQALRAFEAPRATVRRNEKLITIDAKQLVPGDVVILPAGSRVPADVRLTYVNGFKVEEAVLTGESVPVTKAIETLPEDVSLGDRINMAYAGTYAVSGKAEGIIVATGSLTALGDIVRLVMHTEEPQTPLQQQIKKFSWFLGAIMGIITIGIIILGLFKGLSFHTIFTLSIALAVAAIPEGLLISVTVVLAIGMQRMLKRKALVRHLVAAETLGSVSVICTDKTGTLTQGRMAVVSIVTRNTQLVLPDGEQIPQDVQHILTASVLNNDAQVSSDRRYRIGDPTEIALMEAGYDCHIPILKLHEKFPRVKEIPFSSELQYMATVHKMDGQERLVVKGAPEKIISLCVGKEDLDYFMDATTKMTQDGLRVLCVAEKCTEKIDLEKDLNNLTCLGLLGLQDPLRPGVVDTVKDLTRAGIRLVLVTGDHHETAVRIAQGAGRN